jgi:hypothetical protein
VHPHTGQARQQVLQLRQLDLELRFPAAGAQRKDVENQLGPVHHPDAKRIFEALALSGREFIVEDDEIGIRFYGDCSKFLELSGTDVGMRIGRSDHLH